MFESLKRFFSIPEPERELNPVRLLSKYRGKIEGIPNELLVAISEAETEVVLLVRGTGSFQTYAKRMGFNFQHINQDTYRVVLSRYRDDRLLEFRDLLSTPTTKSVTFPLSYSQNTT